MRNHHRAVLIAWVLGVGVSALTLFNVASELLGILAANQPLPWGSEIGFKLLAILFALPAALIISRQPRNTIGWLLMTPALVLATSNTMESYLSTFQTSPPPPSLPIFFMVWYTGTSWLALIIPMLLIGLLFPTGRPPSPRWNWTITLAAGLCIFFFLWSGFSKVHQPEFASWSLINPIGFISEEATQYILPPWVFMLSLLTITSVVSIIVRYRRAAQVEREQMKWLLYACTIFGICYIPGLVLMTGESSAVLIEISNGLFFLAILAIPTATTIAILRYHLFDIDVIIRQTLVFATVTALLGLVYTGGILLLQVAFRTLIGQTSDLAVVVTTLAIAALFNPLRQRVQAIIDRRFYRQKYNAEQALADFAQAARAGSNLDTLTGQLTELVQKTLQPTQVNVYIRARETLARKN